MKIVSRKFIIIGVILSLLVPNCIFASTNEVDKYSKSSVLIDQETGRVLYEKDSNAKRPLASLSKMMTFLLAIEAIKNKEVQSNDIIKVDPNIAKVRGSSYHLKVGEEIPLIELMKGLMIVSGNDAAVAIAKHISKDENEFVKRMNKKAKEIGMSNTNFVNPHGLPIYDLSNPSAPAKENISSAKDIAILGKYMFDNHEKEVTQITDMQTYSYPQRGFEKNNTNALLGIIPEVDGIKTGYTGNAGYCLSFSMMIDKDEKNDKKHRIIGVVLGANHKDKRLCASRTILNYGKNNFHMEKFVENQSIIGKKYIKGISELEVVLKTNNELYINIANNEKINSQLTLKEISYPIKKGDVVGVVKYYNDKGEILGSVEIVSDNDVNKAPLMTRIKMLLTN